MIHARVIQKFFLKNIIYQNSYFVISKCTWFSLRFSQQYVLLENPSWIIIFKKIVTEALRTVRLSCRFHSSFLSFNTAWKWCTFRPRKFRFLIPFLLSMITRDGSNVKSVVCRWWGKLIPFIFAAEKFLKGVIVALENILPFELASYAQIQRSDFFQFSPWHYQRW